jgi:hypothetical protein
MLDGWRAPMKSLTRDLDILLMFREPTGAISLTLNL